MNRYQTYNRIIQHIELFGNQHPNVERVVEEDEDQMSSITSMEELFPMLFITPIDSEFNYDLNHYQIRVYAYDRITKDRGNIQNARSTTNLILNDLDVWLRKDMDMPFDLEDTTNVTPLSSELMTGVVGWYMDIRIDNPNFSICDIPFKDKPKLPIGVCEGYTPEPDEPSTTTINYLNNGNLVESIEYICDTENEYLLEDSQIILFNNNNEAPIDMEYNSFDIIRVQYDDGAEPMFNYSNGSIIIDKPTCGESTILLNSQNHQETISIPCGDTEVINMAYDDRTSPDFIFLEGPRGDMIQIERPPGKLDFIKNVDDGVTETEFEIYQNATITGGSYQISSGGMGLQISEYYVNDVLVGLPFDVNVGDILKTKYNGAPLNNSLFRIQGIFEN